MARGGDAATRASTSPANASTSAHRAFFVAALAPTQMQAVNWLGKARGLFPHQVFETLQSHALDRYGLTELMEQSGVILVDSFGETIRCMVSRSSFRKAVFCAFMSNHSAPSSVVCSRV